MAKAHFMLKQVNQNNFNSVTCVAHLARSQIVNKYELNHASDKSYNKQHMKEAIGKVFDVMSPSYVASFPNTASTHAHIHTNTFPPIWQWFYTRRHFLKVLLVRGQPLNYPTSPDILACIHSCLPYTFHNNN